jgi:hypothetical protein
MSFMQRQITDKVGWIEISTFNGTCFVPAMDVSQDIIDYCNSDSADICEIPQDIRVEVSAFIECIDDSYHIDGVEYIEGHGARLSAPGYMDCTDWSVFDTVEEAEAYLDDMYGDN